jgi:hypothetical protein
MNCIVGNGQRSLNPQMRRSTGQIGQDGLTLHVLRPTRGGIDHFERRSRKKEAKTAEESSKECSASLVFLLRLLRSRTTRSPRRIEEETQKKAARRPLEWRKQSLRACTAATAAA